jgi:hypothetical protein
MEEYKLYFKWPKWLLISLIIGYSIYSIYIVFDTLSFLKHINEYSFLEKIINTICNIFLILFIISAWYVIVASEFKNKYYYIINKKGIYNNQINLWKKYLSWDDELYYCITNKCRGLYTSEMLPLEGEIINDKNIQNGYIFIKSKRVLRKYYDNKNWIMMSTKMLKNNIQIDDTVNMINKTRKNE